MNNFNRVQAINNDLIEAAGTLARGHMTYLTGVEAAANRAKASLQELWANALDSDLVVLFYDILNVLVQVIDKIGVFNSAIIVGGMAIAKKTKDFGPFKAALKTASADLYKLTQALIAQTFAAGKSAAATTSLAAANTSLADSASLAGVKIGVINPLITQTGAAAASASVSMKGLWSAMLPLLKVVAVVAAIGAVTAVIVKAKRAMEDANKEVKEYSNNFLDLRKSSATAENSIESLGERYEELNRKIAEGSGKASTSLNTEELREYGEINDELLTIIPNLSYRMDEYGNKIVDVVGGVDGLIRAYREAYVESEKLFKLHAPRNYQMVLEENEELLDGVKEKEEEIFELRKRAEQEARSSHERAANHAKVQEQFTQAQIEAEERLNEYINKNRPALEALGAQMLPLQLGMNDIALSMAQFVNNDMLVDLALDTDNFVESLKKASGAIDKVGYDELEQELLELSNAYQSGKISKEEYEAEVGDATKQLSDIIKSEQRRLSLMKLSGAATEDQIEVQKDFLNILFGVQNLIRENTEFTIESVNATQEYESAKSRVQAFEEEIEYLNDAYQKLNEGQRINGLELANLIEKYPELNKYVDKNGDLSQDAAEKILEIGKAHNDSTLEALESSRERILALLHESETLTKLKAKIDSLYETGSFAEAMHIEQQYIEQYSKMREESLKGIDALIAGFENREISDLFNKDDDSGAAAVKQIELVMSSIDHLYAYMEEVQNERARLEKELTFIDPSDTQAIEEHEKAIAKLLVQERAAAKMILDAKQKEKAENAAILEQYGLFNTETGEWADNYSDRLAQLRGELKNNESASEELNNAFKGYKDSSSEIHNLEMQLLDLLLALTELKQGTEDWAKSFDIGISRASQLESELGILSTMIGIFQSQLEDAENAATRNLISKKVIDSTQLQISKTEELIQVKQDELQATKATLREYDLLDRSGQLVENLSSKLRDLKDNQIETQEEMERVVESVNSYLSLSQEIPSLMTNIASSIDTLKSNAETLRGEIEGLEEGLESLTEDFKELRTLTLFEQQIKEFEYLQQMLEARSASTSDLLDIQHDINNANIEYRDHLYQQAEELDRALNKTERFSPEWIEIANNLISVNDEIKSINSNLADVAANEFSDRIQKQFEEIQARVEEPLEPELIPDYEDPLAGIDNSHLISGAEKAAEAEKIYLDLKEYGIELTKQQQELLEGSDEIRRSELDVLKAEIALEKERLKLAELQDQRTVQQLRKQSDGRWQFEYGADQGAIMDQEQTVADATLSLEQNRKSLSDELAEENARMIAETTQKAIDKQNRINRAIYEAEVAFQEQQNTKLEEVIKNAENGMYSTWSEFQMALDGVLAGTEIFPSVIKDLETNLLREGVSKEDISNSTLALREKLGDFDYIQSDLNSFKNIWENYQAQMNQAFFQKETNKITDKVESLAALLSPIKDFADTDYAHSVEQQIAELITIETAINDQTTVLESRLTSLYGQLNSLLSNMGATNVVEQPEQVVGEGVSTSRPSSSSGSSSSSSSNSGPSYRELQALKNAVKDTKLSTSQKEKWLEGIDKVKSKSDLDAMTSNVERLKKIAGYSQGGMVEETGLAMLHGSKSKPEGVLNPEDTKIFRNELPNLLKALKSNLTRSYSSTSRNGVSASNFKPAAAGPTEEVHHYHVEFPNVKVADEIQKAFKDLPRIARQKSKKGD